jgi:alpha-beta hydrolase superfamily lysophospholipase
LPDATPFLETFTAGDGYRWRYRRYDAIGPARAQVVCIHGVQSHGGWYEYSCSRLSQAGFTVSFLDRRGAGLNEQDRGDAPHFRRLLDDIAEFLRLLQPPAGSRGRLPVILLAISWGGKLAVAVQRRHPGLVDGLALLSPGFSYRVTPSFRERLDIFASRLFSPRRPFPIPLNEPDLFTTSARWQQFIRDDRLGLREATARFFIESVRLDLYLRLFVRPAVRVPVLLLLAEHDRIIDNARTRKFVEQFASPDKEVIEYSGAHHTLEFEPDPDRHVRDLLHWLERHTDHR